MKGIANHRPPLYRRTSYMMRLGVPAMETQRRVKAQQWRLRLTFWLDVALLFSVCAMQDIAFTGLVLHEWLGLVMVGMVFAHLLLAWGWIATQSRLLFAAQSFRSRVNYLINLSLFAGVTAVIFSGILISQKAIPALTGTSAAPEMDWRWDVLHNRFSQYLLMLSGFHLAINWDWALAAVHRLFVPTIEKAQERFHRFREGAQ